ncbi:MAG TPA: hypothetical protein VGY97_00665, partial [Solirubrobacteraceae bacterium]|nr:hypothetical protein [Solirubrobacteraceae bacterium]
PNGYPKTLMYEGPDSIWFNFIALLYYGQRYHIPVTYQLTTSAPAPSEVQLSSPANFLAVRAATAGPPPAGVRLVREYVLPDKTFLLLYRRA